MTHRLVSFSHVIFVIGEGTCIHATTNGIDLIRLSEIWTSPDYLVKKVVLRNKKINTQIICWEDDEWAKQLHKFTLKSFGAKYSYYFGIPKKWIDDNKWFCSELAATFLKKIGHEIVPNRNPEKIYPGHFQFCLNKSEWEDITDCYESYVKKITDGSDENCLNKEDRAYYSIGEAEFVNAQNCYLILKEAENNFRNWEGIVNAAREFRDKVNKMVLESAINKINDKS